MKKVSNEYIAGVADSDGSFSYNKKFSKQRNKFYYVAQFQITWKYSKESKMFFDFLVKTFGGSYFDGLTHTTISRVRILKYCATGIACENICNAVMEHLILKKEQAKIVLLGAGLKSRHWGSKGKPQKVFDREKALYLRIKKLNTKNNPKSVGAVSEKLI